MLPATVMYKSYMAGDREPNLSSSWVRERNLGWLWEPVAGARAGLVIWDLRRPESARMATRRGRRRFRGSTMTRTATSSPPTSGAASYRPLGKARRKPSSDSITSVPT